MPNITQFSSLNLQGAREILSKAQSLLNEKDLPGAAAVVDASGRLVAFESIDGTMPAASSIAINKAITSIQFARPTIKLENLIQENRIAMLGLNGLPGFNYVPLKGAYPIIVEEKIVGALGIAGAISGENDEHVARATVESFIQYQNKESKNV